MKIHPVTALRNRASENLNFSINLSVSREEGILSLQGPPAFLSGDSYGGGPHKVFRPSGSLRSVTVYTHFFLISNPFF